MLQRTSALWNWEKRKWYFSRFSYFSKNIYFLNAIRKSTTSVKYSKTSWIRYAHILCLIIWQKFLRSKCFWVVLRWPRRFVTLCITISNSGKTYVNINETPNIETSQVGTPCDKKITKYSNSNPSSILNDIEIFLREKSS